MLLNITDYTDILPERNGIIERVWFLRSDNGQVNHHLLPTNRADLLINAGSPMYYDDILAPDAHIAGARNYPSKIRHEGLLRVVGLTFSPYGLSMMTNGRVSEFNGRIAAVENAVSGLSSHLKMIKDHSRPESSMITDICRAVICSANSSRVPDPRFRGMIDDLRRGDIPRNVDDLCARSGYSKRMLERLFHAFIGNTPKEYLRKERFGRIVRIMGSSMRKSLLPDLNLTTLAYDFEFCDQSHMIREFKRFSGVTPSAYRAADYVKGLCGQM